VRHGRQGCNQRVLDTEYKAAARSAFESLPTGPAGVHGRPAEITGAQLSNAGGWNEGTGCTPVIAVLKPSSQKARALSFRYGLKTGVEHACPAFVPSKKASFSSKSEVAMTRSYQCLLGRLNRTRTRRDVPES
jgi:hypothetical protein